MIHPFEYASLSVQDRARTVTSRDMDDEHWVPTGTRSRIRSDTNRVPAFAGEHLWTWTAVFRAELCAKAPTLSSENLLRIVGISCHYCHRQYRQGSAFDSPLCSGPLG